MLDFGKAHRLSLTMQVEANLKHALIIGALEPGARLITRDLAEKLGTSITPVREALLRLVSAGALQAAPSQAFQVPDVSEMRYNEIIQIRKKLEGMAASATAALMTESKLDDLRHHAEVFQEANAKGAMDEALQANYRFRFRLYEYAEMPTLTTLIEQLWVRIGPCFNYLQQQSGGMTIPPRFYDELLAMLERKDPEKSAAAICHAIEQWSNILQRQYIN